MEIALGLELFVVACYDMLLSVDRWDGAPKEEWLSLVHRI